jgi:imidazoleglycerol-phosphate dehydratase
MADLPNSTSRIGEVRRETKETKIAVRLSLDDPSKKSIETGVGFFDHMLDALATHARLGLELKAEGDLHVDSHHLVEDVGIAMGAALRQALGDDLRIRRFASAFAPLDDALVRAVVDISGRAYCHYGIEPRASRVGEFDTELAEEFFRAFTSHGGLNLHLDLIHGRNTHHQLEAAFKATALALREALRPERSTPVPSTKGTLSENQARSGS